MTAWLLEVRYQLDRCHMCGFPRFLHWLFVSPFYGKRR